MNLLKSFEYFDPATVNGAVHIIGVGSVGSTVAENLARFGITKFVLYDFDFVEQKNIVNQMFTLEDVGKMKTDAVKEMILRINNEANIKTVSSGYEAQRLSGYVFLCVDSIEVRKQIVSANKNNKFIKAMFDFRTRLTDAQHYAADWSDEMHIRSLYNSMDFTHEEASAVTEVSACGITLGVATTVRLITGAGVANFVNFVRGDNLATSITIDTKTLQMKSMWFKPRKPMQRQDE